MESVGAGPRRVLLVEDNPDDALVISLNLRDAGIEVHTTDTLESLEVLVESTRCEVVLLDLGIPPLYGLETYRAARDKVAEVPIVVITGNDDLRLARAAVAEGAQDCLVKGLDTPERIVWSIEHAIARHGIVAGLRDLGRLREEFVGSAAHDLRSPLTVVLGMIDLLDQRWDKIDEQTRRELVSRAASTGRRLQVLAEDILTLGQLDAGVMPVEIHAVGVRDAVASAAELTAFAEDVDAGGSEGFAVRADESHLVRILTNYLTNAHRYGRPPYAVECVADDGFVVVAVTDRGPGVSPDFVPGLFERFSRADQDRGLHRNATGLGLSIVAGLAAANGGRAYYEPNPGGGSRFCVVLPAA